MATYKVLQDIEAEDKILGPLTLRQFIYAGASAVCLYLTYFVIHKGVAFMGVVFLLPALVAAFFAFPWGRDQPTEIWALAKIRFMLKPRRRVWDQSGAKELVTVTAPKKEVVDYTKGLSQTEVSSRLRALADTLDSRGWAVKNANLNLVLQPSLVTGAASSDRLVGPGTLPQAVDDMPDIQAADDMLDERNNPTAQHVNSMIEASAKAHRQKILDSLQNETPAAAVPAAPAASYWFLNQPAQAPSVPKDMVTFNTQVVTPGTPEEDLTVAAPAEPTAAEENLVKQLSEQPPDLPMTAYYGHLHTIQPLSAEHRRPVAPAAAMPGTSQPVAAPAAQMPTAPPTVAATPQPVAPAPTPTPAQPQATPAQQAAILQLANNNDLNVATIAREAQRSGPQDEVVIKLR